MARPTTQRCSGNEELCDSRYRELLCVPPLSHWRQQRGRFPFRHSGGRPESPGPFAVGTEMGTCYIVEPTTANTRATPQASSLRVLAPKGHRWPCRCIVIGKAHDETMQLILNLRVNWNCFIRTHGLGKQLVQVHETDGSQPASVWGPCQSHQSCEVVERLEGFPNSGLTPFLWVSVWSCILARSRGGLRSEQLETWHSRCCITSNIRYYSLRQILRLVSEQRVIELFWRLTRSSGLCA